MKYRYLALAAVWIVSGWTLGIAQPADKGITPEPTSPPPPIEQDSVHKGLDRFLESLPPETRKRFEAAREKALQDPKLQELREAADRAKRDFLKVMREKMLEIDPDLAGVIKNRAGERKSGGAGGRKAPPLVLAISVKTNLRSSEAHGRRRRAILPFRRRRKRSGRPIRSKNGMWRLRTIGRRCVRLWSRQILP